MEGKDGEAWETRNTGIREFRNVGGERRWRQKGAHRALASCVSYEENAQTGMCNFLQTFDSLILKPGSNVFEESGLMYHLIKFPLANNQ